MLKDRQRMVELVDWHLDPLSRKSDEHQICLYSINTKSMEKIMRINKMITKRKSYLKYVCQLC